MNLFDEPPTLESLLTRIEALEAKVMDKPVRQSTEVPPELREAWSLWYLHKAGCKDWSAAAKRQQVKRLAEVSGLNPERALRIVEVAIEKGWRTFYELKDEPKLSLVPKAAGAKAAFTPSETPLERQRAWARQQLQLGAIDQSEHDRIVAEATQKHRGVA